MGVQHQGANGIVDTAVKQLPKGASESDIINAFYDARAKYVSGLSKVPKDTKKMLQDRYVEERQEVLHFGDKK